MNYEDFYADTLNDNSFVHNVILTKIPENCNTNLDSPILEFCSLWTNTLADIDDDHNLIIHI